MSRITGTPTGRKIVAALADGPKTVDGLAHKIGRHPAQVEKFVRLGAFRLDRLVVNGDRPRSEWVFDGSRIAA